MQEQIRTYYIIKEHPLRIISKCRAHSKGTLLQYLLGVVIIYVIMNWIPDVLSLFIPVTVLDLYSGIGTSIDRALLENLPDTSLVMYFYSVLFSGVFRLGECLYVLTYIRSRKVEYRAIGEAFPLYAKALGVYMIQLIVVAIWSMFFIIPGIIAALNFSQAFFILADDPKKGMIQVLGESKMMMRGNRITYIRLLIYYLPYIVFAYLPAFMIPSMPAWSSFSYVYQLIIMMLADLPVFFALGFMSLGRCVFYELLTTRGFADFNYAGQDAFRELENRTPSY